MAHNYLEYKTFLNSFTKNDDEPRSGHRHFW